MKYKLNNFSFKHFLSLTNIGKGKFKLIVRVKPISYIVDFNCPLLFFIVIQAHLEVS